MAWPVGLVGATHHVLTQGRCAAQVSHLHVTLETSLHICVISKALGFWDSLCSGTGQKVTSKKLELNRNCGRLNANRFKLTVDGPAAAVIRRLQALSGFTGCKGRVGGDASWE